MAIEKSKRIFPILIIFSILVLEMATDLYAPSLPEIASYFEADTATIVMTISGYLLGFSLPGALFGPLSDSLGRRPLFLFGSSIFCAASFAAWVSPTIHLLIVSRFCQGVGAGIFYVLSPAIIKDSFDEKVCSRIFSSIGMVVTLSPMVAPILGATIANQFGWSTNFALISLAALTIATICFFWLPESLAAEQRSPFSWSRIFKTYKQLLMQPSVIGFASISGIAFGGLWGWIATAPFYFINSYGLSPIDYSYYAAIGPFAYILGTVFNQRFVEKFGVINLFNFGLTVMTIGSILLFTVVYYLSPNLFMIALPLVAYTFGLAPVFANSTTRAVSVGANQRGVASAILCTCEMFGASLGAFSASLLENGTLQPAALIILLSVILCNVIYFSSKFRPQNPDILPVL